MTYPLSPITCKLCKNLDRKISMDKDNKAVGKCRELNRKVYLDNTKECEKFTFFLEKEKEK